jgi:hypothetical protein
MQPIYQIPGAMLEMHAAKLRACGRVADCPPRLHALLFLSGLRLAFAYWAASQKGHEFFTAAGPAHRLDDGLELVAVRCLRFLLGRARSRETRDSVRLVRQPEAPGWKWATVSFSFAGLFEDAPATVRKWLARDDLESARLRLACGMGVRALWDAAGVGFVQKMMREPFGLDRDEHAAIEAFELTPETALPEL